MQTSHNLIPDFIRRMYREGRENGSFSGAAIFVDLSGFSALTDALSAHGAYGAEILTDIMRLVFEPLVNAVFEQGGFVVGYAGDAFNAVFPSEGSAADAALRALSAAAAMQEHLASHAEINTPYGGFSIRIKAGIGFGDTTWQIFRSASGKRASYWFRGDSLRGAVSSEESARAGQILLDEASHNLLGGMIDAEPVNRSFLVRKITTRLPEPRTIPRTVSDDELNRIFLADAILHLPAIGEFRQVVNLFIDIPTGISDRALITPFMETIYTLQEQYGGFFLRPDLGDKGFNLLIFWGAPTAHENDVERALNFILELSERTRIPLGVGISYHMAYTGFMGSGLREDYTAYGWGVNLAARMMEHSRHGELWMDSEVARRAERAFRVRPLGEFAFKGFQQKQSVFALVGRKHSVDIVYQGQLVGRKRELDALAVFLEPVNHGRFAGVMVLEGEAGIGKSRLIHAFQHSRYFEEFPAKWVVCQTDEILRQPFNPLTGWLRKRFDLADHQSDMENWESFLHNLEELAGSIPDPELSAELLRTSSILAGLVNLRQASSLYETLDAKGRYDNTLLALVTLMKAESLKRPLVLLIEDIHWLDEDTAAFLNELVRSLGQAETAQYPLAILATQRPEGKRADFVHESAAKTLVLDKLASPAIARLAADILGHPIADSLLALLEERAEGNPFFTEQILRFLSEHQALGIDEDGKYFAYEQAQTFLPADIRSVMAARLDRLPQPVKDIVQTASVLGREFESRLLEKMAGTPQEFQSLLQQAEQAGIWSSSNRKEYLFRHALLRDAAYSMQLQSSKVRQHRAAVLAIEELYGGDLRSHYSTLGYHAEKAVIRDKALKYLQLAGREAQAQYQNQQAIDHLTRALAFVPPGDLRVKFDLLMTRVEVYYNLSNSTAQLKGLDVLEELAAEIGDNALLARVFMRRAYCYAALGDFQKVLDHAFRAKELAEAAADGEALGMVFLVLPNSLIRLGRSTEALKIAREGLEFAKVRNDADSTGRAYSALGLISLEVESPSAAMRYQEQALSIAREHGNKYLEAVSLNNLANTVGLALGDFFTARNYFEQAHTIAQELGNVHGRGMTLLNLGWLSGIVGDYANAVAYNDQALALLHGLGLRSQEMAGCVNMSAVMGMQNQAEEALHWAKRAQALASKLGDPSGEGWAYFYMGYARLLGRDHEQAAADLQTSIEIRSALNAEVLTAEARAGLAQVYLELEDPASAQQQAELILSVLENNPGFEGAEEPLRIFLTLHRILANNKDPRAGQVLQNANLLLDAQVSKFPSEEARRQYVENVPWRRAIRQLSAA